ncbi:putative 1-carboxy-3-chloro-3,4-dihydroxycyclohexa-1, 5-diene dehydrogenase [Candidatus Kuenenia stuttgartiensis]|jgi:predicted dehydrogenase|uniref:Putative 1-carboxy-3-chloro-3,4-dihydroxycyclohexa-1, 5-diene dehydrogenase n=1 Tax=Kuenenia stuttgartiensis TaxID=174633 RepID=Q1Q7H7_KUEST|nr:MULTISPECIES: Gfo/Idh/MocA family oxidoreductase [Kuenenia]MBE7548035.1 Gfo/Idh/MocA family oxidoreductase [Planctomycetia bacterium]MBZ0192243.1 Gfo/Idh/MocA family oxidoreductase [Candidatus Kuenenia stuttgartiensis]MCF6152454.1 Gfo/Idh/MocA family oxidoreductase [Candidatus Kuenenia stuttgartiensis]MCL4726657.1 Gfo/Idh/MocA family oxidoreductase [Candidatus Kuenenia stuttgartiensis]MCZ7622555.1 Gfo/Idh/MocA family oxidoreductase [Candidatus Kuenenia sp.]
MHKLKVAVIGVGHLGKEHARVFAELPGVELVGVVDALNKQAEEIARRYNTQWYVNYQDVIDKVSAVSIAVPTKSHYAIAKDFLTHGVHVLVEKPMTGTVSEAKELISLSKKKGLVLQAGYIERFNPVIVAIKKISSNPRFIECHRLSPFTFRSADIGVVLDLMIHDIDIILNMTGSKVKKIDAVGVNVIADKEDIANARIQFQNGCVANITASRVSIQPMRKVRLFSEDSYISIDYQKKEGLIYKKSPKLTLSALNISEMDVSTIADLKSHVFGDLLKVEHIKMDDYEPLKKELESFVTCVLENKEPEVSGEEGLKAIEVANDILQEIERNLAHSRAQCMED